MKKIIRLTESDLARIVRRVISEQIVDPTNPANVASTTSVNKLSTTGGPKPVDLMPKGCLKGYVMDKTQKYYQKMDARGYTDVKVYPSGKWSQSDGVGQTKGYGYSPSDSTVEWGTWKCSGDNILFDRTGTNVGQRIFLDNGDSFSDNEGGSYSVGRDGWQSLSGTIVSKTPDPKYNTYEIKVKGVVGNCARVWTKYLIPGAGSGSFEYPGLQIEKC
jgi:hypothetical protein